MVALFPLCFLIPDPYFDHVSERHTCIAEQPSMPGRWITQFEKRLRWTTDTNLFHRVVGCGPVVEFTRQARNRATGQGNVKGKCGALWGKRALCLCIVLVLAAV